MLNKDKFLDFISENELVGSDSSQLFSYSQPIEMHEFLSLKFKLLNDRDFLFYWGQPSEDFYFIAKGELYSICTNEFRNLFQLDEQLNDLPFKTFSNRTNISLTRDPLFVGGIKFPSGKRDERWNDFDFAKWSIPNILLLKSANDYKVIINVIRNHSNKNSFWNEVGELFSTIELSGNETPHNKEIPVKVLSNMPRVEIDEWSNQIQSALEKISHNKLQKVVLSRYNEIELSGPLNIANQLDRLESNFGNCDTFAYKSKESFFFGTSPEKLFRVRDGLLETDALAGSIQRGIDDAEERILEERILCDEKNLAEHKTVVDFLLFQLTPLTEKILFDSQPSIKKYSNIQHLYSQIRAKLKSDVSFFSLLEKLYPTPAVCGFPSDQALSVINELEDFDRGLYSGAIGWFNLSGSADFSVGIRSALLRGNILQAYAGCGIVKGSDPLSEYIETELKQKPILNLFADEAVCKS